MKLQIKNKMIGLIITGSILALSSCSNPEEIKAEVHSLRQKMKGYPFILGADCTLATDKDRNKIKAAVEAARDIL